MRVLGFRVVDSLSPGLWSSELAFFNRHILCEFTLCQFHSSKQLPSSLLVESTPKGNSESSLDLAYLLLSSKDYWECE